MPPSTGLLIVDMQNDFVLEGSAFRIAGALATLPSVRALLDTARQRQWLVTHVVREHRADGSDVEKPRREAFLKSGGYAVAGTRGADIVEELEPKPNELRIVKTRFSGFMHTDLDLRLRRHGIRRVVLCGTQYPNCIRATAFDALSLDYDVTVVTCATSAETPEAAEANIHDLRNVGITCVSLDALLRDMP